MYAWLVATIQTLVVMWAVLWLFTDTPFLQFLCYLEIPLKFAPKYWHPYTDANGESSLGLHWLAMQLMGW